MFVRVATVLAPRVSGKDSLGRCVSDGGVSEKSGAATMSNSEQSPSTLSHLWTMRFAVSLSAIIALYGTWV
jgi:hypothetical protein